MLLPKIIKPLIRFAFRVTVNGRYKNPSDKSLIIANHSSFLDGVLLALFLPITPVFVIHTEIANHWLFRCFLRYVDYLVVDPAHPMAMKKVVNLLNSGRSVVIFPEGRITTTGSLMKVYAGAAFAATRSQAMIVPVHISGAKYSYFSRVGGLFKRRLLPKLTLTILPATTISSQPSLSTRQRRQEAKEKMHQLMMAMMVASREKCSLYEQLLAARQTHGKNRVIYEDGSGQSLTYNNFVKKTVVLSTLLKPYMMSERVGLLLPNSHAGVLNFYALQHRGLTPVMINYTAGIRAIKAGLTACQSNTLITSRQFIDKANLGALIHELANYQIIYLEDLYQSMTWLDKLSMAIKGCFPRFTAARQQADDEAVVLFTSGSEGFPKGVVHSHDSLLMNVAQIQAIYDFNPADKLMICLPTFHVFGLAAGTLLPIATGASAVLYPNPLHYRAIPEVIYDRNCTILLSTSTFLAGYARFADTYDFHQLRYVIAGAEKLATEVAQTYYQRFGIRVLEGYGSTETAPVIAANTLMTYQSGSVGQLLPGMTATLIAAPELSIPQTNNQTCGRLTVSGDNVMLGYLHAERPGQIEPSPMINGKRSYDTGDIVCLDEKGYVSIVGRAKRFAKIAGEMVALDSVEEIATAASSQYHHAVITVANEKKGEALVLFTTDHELTRSRLQQVAKEGGFSELMVPREIRYRQTIPLFASGKTNYQALTHRESV